MCVDSRIRGPQIRYAEAPSLNMRGHQRPNIVLKLFRRGSNWKALRHISQQIVLFLSIALPSYIVLYCCAKTGSMALLVRSAGSVVARATTPRGLPRMSTAGLASKSAPASLRRKPVIDRNVLVTGSARGIGRAIALRLASDGYNVCINDIAANSKACDEVVKNIEAMGRKACSAVADVSKRCEVKDMVQRTVRELGPLHTM